MREGKWPLKLKSLKRKKGKGQLKEIDNNQLKQKERKREQS